MAIGRAPSSAPRIVQARSLTINSINCGLTNSSGVPALGGGADARTAAPGGSWRTPWEQPPAPATQGGCRTTLRWPVTLRLKTGEGRARPAEDPRGRIVGLVELNVATPSGAPAQRVGSAGEGRVDDHTVLGQLDVELVRGAWFARVRDSHSEVDVAEPVCPRRATNPPSTGRLAGLGVSARWSVGEVRGDVVPVDVQVEAVVMVFEVAPVRNPGDPRTVPAAPSDGKRPFAAVGEDEAATGQEVALRQRRRRSDVRVGQAADDHERRDPKYADHCSYHYGPTHSELFEGHGCDLLPS